MRPPSALAVIMHDPVPVLDRQEAILELCCSLPSLRVCLASRLHCEQRNTDTVTFTLSLWGRPELRLCNPSIASFSLFPCWPPLTFPPRESPVLPSGQNRQTNTRLGPFFPRSLHGLSVGYQGPTPQSGPVGPLCCCTSPPGRVVPSMG